MGASIALRGKAEPTNEKLSTAHSADTLIDIRSDGNRPNVKMPNAWEERTVRTASNSIGMEPPG